MIAFTLGFVWGFFVFSIKTIIFTHAADSALFSVFLTITHALNKLKRLFTFDNFSVPFFTTGSSKSEFMQKDNDPPESLFTLVFLLICMPFFYCT